MITLLAAMAVNDWKLVWSDEFDKAGKPDPAKWTHEIGYIRNKELQFYTDRAENARIENGKLIIDCLKDNWDGKPITSASLTTAEKASWTYGKVEVRAKIPTGKGTWPAIWMLGTNRKEVGWPKCGEIDIMENVGNDPDTIVTTVHTEDRNHTKKTHVGKSFKMDKPYADFHVYGIEWFEDRIDFFIDGTKRFTYENDGKGNGTWPFDKPHYLLINFAFGGTWGGSGGVDESILPLRYEIDWVRVYQRK